MDKEEKEVIGIEITGLVVLIAVVAFWPVILDSIKSSPYLGNFSVYLTGATVVLKWVLSFLTGLSLPLSLFFMIVTIYCVEGLKVIRKKEALMYDTKTEPAYEQVGESGDAALAHRWNGIMQHISSANPNDWKQAIIDADIILEDILTKMGYQGESIGEKLKRVDPGDMKNLNDAWEAHKVRNRIAHDGSDYSLNQIEAQQVIARYKKVFEEFFYI
jgi:hypothetical protein